MCCQIVFSLSEYIARDFLQLHYPRASKPPTPLTLTFTLQRVKVSWYSNALKTVLSSCALTVKLSDAVGGVALLPVEVGYGGNFHCYWRVVTRIWFQRIGCDPSQVLGRCSV
ncbi:hypothetical protein TSMEX_011258 [Taenia solium]|eukprot:TsM_000223200 transcript=TsM_000223200 gene=TsM_000223200